MTVALTGTFDTDIALTGTMDTSIALTGTFDTSIALTGTVDVFVEAGAPEVGNPIGLGLLFTYAS